MTDRDVIERVNALFPCNKIGVIDPKPMRPHYKQPKRAYTWRIRKPDTVRDILELILPYLGERRSTKAIALLTHLDTRPGTGGTHRARTHCAKGHEYSPENTYVNPANGYRSCRTCQRASAAAHHRAHRDELNARQRIPGGRGPYKKRSVS